MEEKQEFNGFLLNNLGKIKKWTKFLSILSYIAMVLFVIFAVVMGVFSSSFNSVDSQLGFLPGPLFALIYLLGAAAYYFSAKFMGDMSSAAELAKMSSDTKHIESLIEATAKLFTFWGIVVLVGLILYALIFLMGIIGFATMI